MALKVLKGQNQSLKTFPVLVFSGCQVAVRYRSRKEEFICRYLHPTPPGVLLYFSKVKMVFGFMRNDLKHVGQHQQHQRTRCQLPGNSGNFGKL